MTPNIHILTPSMFPYDAIGNDVVQMQAILRESGYSVDVFAQGIHPSRADVAKPLSSVPQEYWNSPEDIFIYHHSMGWPLGEEVLFRTRNKIILRYHNITPVRFFAPYSDPFAQGCAAGVESTKRIAQIPDMLVLGASTFNCDDFISLGVAPQHCRVLAPFHLTEELGREQFHVPTVQQYSGDIVNILFVGGIKPNKGHARAIRVFAKYNSSFNRRSRLIFAGGTDERLSNYVQDLIQLAASLGVAGNLVFTGPVTASQIKTLYTVADVFLCTSEHEGFCVPLLEAMYFRTPIVAWGVTAVSETMGRCSFLLDDWNEFHFASHIHRLVEDSGLAAHCGDSGRERYFSAYSPEALGSKLCAVVEEVAQRPRTH
jgi:glycosyltransferase involved in cell wall biosynthesis